MSRISTTSERGIGWFIENVPTAFLPGRMKSFMTPSPTGHSLAECSPAEPDSASPAKAMVGDNQALSTTKNRQLQKCAFTNCASLRASPQGTYRAYRASRSLFCGRTDEDGAQGTCSGTARRGFAENHRLNNLPVASNVQMCRSFIRPPTGIPLAAGLACTQHSTYRYCLRTGP